MRTHHAREPLMMEGGTSFTFVTDGIESALDSVDDLHGLVLVNTVAAPNVMHLKFAKQ